MNAVYPPGTGLPTPSAPFHGHTAAPGRPKLRNSCHPCASSKLKCPQEKPTCSRCAKRGLTCEYVVAKRGGRKPNSRSTTNETRGSDASITATDTNGTVHFPSPASWAITSSSYPNIDTRQSSGAVHHSNKANVSRSLDLLQDFFGPTDQALSSTSTDIEMDLDDLFTTPISLSSEMSDLNIFGAGDFFPTGVHSDGNGSDCLTDTFPVFGATVPERLPVSIPSSTPKNSTSPSGEIRHCQEVRTTDSSWSCLGRALGIMKQLFPSPSNTCMTWTTQGLERATTIPSTQAVIAQNEATIEAVSTMLKCSCSQDGYLLAIMSLIIFKVLGWYAAVARDKHGSQSLQACHLSQSSPSEQPFQSPTTVGSYCLDGTDSARMAAQLVLSELHRVRRVVDQLSSKLKVQATNKGRREGTETPESSDPDSEMTLPISAVMYDQLDVDLRGRLRALSWEMIDRLRRL